MSVRYNRSMRRPGFTLAELLIALLILGVIATFTIPKVLQSQESSQQKSVFKETISVVNNMVYHGAQQGELQCDNMVSYFKNHLNYISVSSSGANHTFLLANGSTIWGVDDSCVTSSCFDNMIIDWNGPLPPNVDGSDRINLNLAFEEPCPPYTAGRISPFGAPSITLYNSTFQ